MLAKNSVGRVRRWATASSASLLVMCLIFSVTAQADISQSVFTIHAVNESGSAVYSADFDDGVWDPGAQTYNWALSSSISMVDGAAAVATLHGAGITIEMTPAPRMSFTFDVTSGDSDTEFLVESAVVNFNTIPSDEAGASFLAGCSVYDSGAGDGMWIYEPGLGGFGVFQSYYNTNPEPEELFSDLISVVGSPDGGMASGAESQPGSGYLPLGADIYDACMRASFVLTDLDRAQGNAAYALVPEPASLAILALGLFSIAARGTRDREK